MEEIWKPIKGYEDYQVSNLGRIKSLKNGKEKIMTPGVLRKGYLGINLCKNGIQKPFKIHRLIAETFLDNPDNLPQVNHKDENKQNNRVDNLEWCDNTYNIRYSWSKPVGCYKDGQLIKTYEAIQDAIQDGFQKSAICRCCKGKKKQYYGLEWAYIN